jgi:hypothetical protein
MGVSSVRPSSIYLATTGAAVALLVAGWVDARVRTDAEAPSLAAKAALVERLGLTDLALFTEARYTRHPSQSDRHAPFQDHPFAFEHFPTGSLLAPPRAGRGQP